MDMCVVHVVTPHSNNSLEQQHYKDSLLEWDCFRSNMPAGHF